MAPARPTDSVQKRREVLDVVARVGRLLRERLDQLEVELLRAPGQEAVLGHELAAVARDGLVEVARQRREGRRAVGVHVEEVSRRLFRA